MAENHPGYEMNGGVGDAEMEDVNLAVGVPEAKFPATDGAAVVVLLVLLQFVGC
jgi:hypothetical protein